MEGKIKIITPSWIINCIKSDKLLDEQSYIPSEDADTKDSSQNEEDTDNTHVSMTTSSKPSLPTDPLKTKEPISSVFISPVSTESGNQNDKHEEKDGIVEVRETPVKTEGESSHKYQFVENMVSRHEPCAVELEPQVTDKQVETAEDRNGNTIIQLETSEQCKYDL